MNPETQSTRAKITQTSVNSVAQAMEDTPQVRHGWSNSGDVGLHKTAGGSSASVTDLGQFRSTRSADHLG
ncbi:hypothetical protein B0I31_103764 [Saccharothrix carnea]|uniref:Uncharacterized protein n=1 Tax=Saccharothrix carnea TaxID=1280637 RepID=A0A2P8IEX2_SACCR|nr:hypothetical protein B0I31_103764 [Saccharothrix carnea]